MTSSEYPENILPQGPTSLNPETVSNEISSSRYAIALSSGYAAICSALAGSIPLPETFQAVEASNWHDVASNGAFSGVLITLAGLGVANVRAYRKRLQQAHYNRLLLDIQQENGLD